MNDARTPATNDKPWFDRLAHDLRSPLTSLQTAAYLLRTDPGGANSRELADIVVRQSQRMARMIEELDDWGRAQQGRLVDRGERRSCASRSNHGLSFAGGVRASFISRPPGASCRCRCRARYPGPVA